MIDTNGPFELALTLGTLVRGRWDPTSSFEGETFWRATRTPAGPATMRVRARSQGLEVGAWGAGAEWVIEHACELTGAADDPSAFVAHHPAVREMQRRHPGIRLAQTRSVTEATVASIIEQKVTGPEAGRAYAALVVAEGERAPGPAELLLPPAPERLAGMPYHAFHPFGIERRRADAIRRVCARAGRLEEIPDLDRATGYARLLSFRGVGPWTAAEVMRVTTGDPDAVSVGDYHLPNQVAWVLAGEARADDARMLALLEPYRGQRARAIRLIEATGVTAPRRGPRRALRSIARI